jgi:hypothetical protein
MLIYKEMLVKKQPNKYKKLFLPASAEKFYISCSSV